jgi:hypothetical protein
MSWMIAKIGLAAVAFLCAASCGGAVGELKLYVSANGNDTASGESASARGAKGPFQTLERARDEIRALKQAGKLPDGGIVVELQPGTYELAQPFALTAEDSGSEKCPITYRAKRGGEVRLVGGKVVSGFKPVTDAALLQRLDPAARGKVVQVDLKALGITDFGEPSGGWGQNTDNRLELFYNDEPMTIARWPNEGFVHVAGVTDEEPVDVRGTKGSKAPKFIYDEKELGDRPQRWAQEQDLWIHGWWFWDWAEGRQPLESIDTVNHLITMKPPLHPYGYRKGQWWYAYNALCEIDTPGEWFLDRTAGLLYFWPPSPLTKSTATVSVLPSLITMADCTDVTLRGLTLEATRGIPLTMRQGVRNRVVACVVRNCGGYAMSIEGLDNAVVGCDMYNMGDGGVVLSGGDRATLTPGNNVVDNCHIHHYSRWNRIVKPGILINGVGQKVTHNLIDNAPHMAMMFGGNDHVIEYNEMHSVVYESNDAGIIYAGRNWSMCGTVIRYNYMHHVDGFLGRGCVGVYLDDQFGGTKIESNVFYKVTRAAMIGGGRNCSIDNNVFVDCAPATHVDARGLGWASSGEEGLVKGLTSMPYKESPWKDRYPWLLTLLDDDRMAPKYDVISRNICVGGRWGDFEAKAKPGITFTDNLLDQDPLFVGAARIKANAPRATDFALEPESPALKLGFKPLPLEQMGLYQSPDRASWPVKSVIRPSDAPPPGTAAAPVPRGPMPTLKITRLAGPVAIDGNLDPAEWGGPEKAVKLEQALDGSKVKLPSTAWIAHDGAALLVAVDNQVDPSQKLMVQAQWGENDAVEIAVRDTAQGVAAPILVLRGYPNGVFHSDEEAGATPQAAKKAAQGVEYQAKVIGPGRWVTEWRIPFASLGLDVAKQPKFAFSLTARKTGGDDTWVQWQGTRDRATWQADVAGYLEIVP